MAVTKPSVIMCHAGTYENDVYTTFTRCINRLPWVSITSLNTHIYILRYSLH